MSRTPKRSPKGGEGAAVTKSIVPIERIDGGSFRRNLYQLRTAQGLSMSDLARKIWGTKVDPKTGYEVPVNKDRISRWEKGDQTPEPQNLQLVADALGVTVADLAPDLTAKSMTKDDDPAIKMTMVTGQPDKVHLIVNVLTSLDVASKIIALLSDDPLTVAQAR